MDLRVSLTRGTGGMGPEDEHVRSRSASPLTGAGRSPAVAYATGPPSFPR